MLAFAFGFVGMVILLQLLALIIPFLLKAVLCVIVAVYLIVKKIISLFISQTKEEDNQI